MGIIHDIVCVPLELLMLCQCVDPRGYCQRRYIGEIYTCALSVL